MKIGIIIYSQTGNTLSVAKKIEEKLIAEKHNVILEQIQILGKAHPGSKDIKFKNIPDVSQYDKLLFGAPVQAFSLAIPMSAYLSQLNSLQGKKATLLVTQQFPFPWMGGSRTVRQMKKLCESKGVKIIGSEIVNWSKSTREQQIAEVVERLTGLFV